MPKIIEDAVVVKKPPRIAYRPQPRPKPIERKWEERRIKITCYWHIGGVVQRAEHRTVQAQVYGAVAVYRLEEDRSDWRVSLVPCDMMICAVDTEADAKRIGEVLQERCCLAVRLTDVEQVRAKCAPWVNPWIKECQQERRWIEPPKD